MRLSLSFKIGLLLAALAAAAPPSALAEQAAVVLSGRVFDPMHAPVAGARVAVEADGRPVGEPALSDAQGAFTLTLPPGRCTVTVGAPGFVATSVVVASGQQGSKSLDIVLQIAGVHELVDVAGTAAGYQVPAIRSATKSTAPVRDVPQSISVVNKELIRDQQMTSLADVVRYMPGLTAHQGENNRDQLVIRGNSSSADFFLDGVRDDVQYYRDVYNLDRVEALKGPNAMIFGRGGGGGVLNRVTKQAELLPLREVTALAGAFDHKRLTADLDQALSETAAVRLNAMYENSGSFRDFVSLERYGITPTFTFVPDAQTKFTLGYEHFRDNRTADRGVPSFNGRPATPALSTYFGNPDDSSVHARVDLVSAMFNHDAGNLNVHNRTLAGGYERQYQNYVPGAVTPDRAQVSLSAYNNDTSRLNVFNQTDITFSMWTGGIGHTLLAGAEVGRQSTDNLRNTGYFNNSALSVLVPFDAPTIRTPVVFRQSATDADNHVTATVAAAYAHDRIELSRFVQVLAGVRVDRFSLAFHNNRTGDDLDRTDGLVSPRLGVVFKPIIPVSIYGSYSVSHLPSAGDQFSSLTSVTEQVEPERFTNYEAGVKWDARPALAFTAAVYRLDRTHTRATDPNNATRIVQTGSQRTNGVEVGLTGRVTQAWQIIGGYSYQDAFVTSATTAAPSGAIVAQVPHHMFSLWNAYQWNPRIAAGLGLVSRGDMFAAIDDAAVVPGYVVADAAIFVGLTPRLRLQGNLENALGRRYFTNADNNTNISPGAPRSLRVSLLVRF